jgi:peroxiredoxin
MKTKLLAAMIAVSLFWCGATGLAADTNDVSVQLQALVKQVQTKLSAGQKTEQDLAVELKAFDDLLAEHNGEKTDAVARVLFMKAMLYIEVLNDPDKGTAAIKQLKSDFPDTPLGKRADTMLAKLTEQAAAKKIQSALVEGTQFPDFDEQDVAGKPVSIANYKGKVVLIDFWATWCGPCVGELPNVLKVYQKHHDQGFEIIGISLDEDKQKLDSFTKEHNMTWQQFFDGKGWGNKLAAKYGVQSIPATYLLDGNGNIIAKDLRGEALETAVTGALAKK